MGMKKQPKYYPDKQYTITITYKDGRQKSKSMNGTQILEVIEKMKQFDTVKYYWVNDVE